MQASTNIINFNKEEKSHTAVKKERKARTLRSCLVCRQRKIKCDGQKPVCGACIKRDKTHLCRYDGTQWSVQIGNTPQKNSVTEINQIKGIINTTISTENVNNQKNKNCVNKFIEVDPHNLDNELIDFYQNRFQASVSYSQGVLTWISLLRKDKYLNAIGVASQTARELINESKRLNHKDSQIQERWKSEDPNNNFKHAKILHMNDLVKEIELVVADRKLVWLLVDKFFNSEMYLAMPLLDKDEFSEELEHLLGPRNKPTDKLVIPQKADLSILGTLIVIMRLTSLSSYNFGKPQSKAFNSSELYIFKNQIPKDVMILVHKIDTELSKFKAPKISIFQFLAVKTYYEYYGPEECDCVKMANSSKIGQLLQYSTNCSLNRDPTSSNILSPNRHFNALRRLWYEIVFLDSYQMLLVGCPSLIDSKFYDTHLPHLDESLNEFDYVVNEWFYERSKIYEVCNPLVNSMLNIRLKPRIGTIKEQLEPLLIYINKLGTLEDIIKAPCDTLIQRCQKFKDASFILDAYSMIYMVYYHFTLFYNDKNDMENFLHYVLETVKISGSLFEFALFLDPNAKKYDLQKQFGSGVILFPKLESTLHKVSQMMLGVLSRIKAMKIFAGSKGLKPQTTEAIDKIHDVANRTIIFIVSCFVQVSNIYYHPWIVSKVQSFIMKNVLNIPKGRYYTNINEVDEQFMKSISDTKGQDDLFFKFDIKDLTKLADAFSKYKKIYNYSQSQNDLSIQFEESLIAEIDKTWFEQMHHDYNNGADYESKINNSASVEIDKELKAKEQKESGDLSYNNSIESNKVFNDDFLTEEISNMDNLINSNLDLMDFDNIFNLYGTEKNPF